MRKTFSKLYYLFFTIFSFFFITLGIIIIFLQTDFGKTKLELVIQKGFATRGIHVNFSEIKGFLPFQWTFTDLEVEYEKKKISAQSISLRISFLKLLKNTLSLYSVTGSSIRFEGFNTGAKQHLEPIQINLPFSIQLKSFDLHEVYLSNTNEPINLKGSARIEKNGKYFSLKTDLTRDEFINSFVHLNLRAEKQRLVQLRVNGNIENANFIDPFYPKLKQGSIQFRVYAMGAWNSFENILFQNIEEPLENISGNIFVSTQMLQFFENENIDFLFTPKWDYQGDFTLSKDHTLTFVPISITSEFASIQANLTVSNFSEIEKGTFTFQSKNLNFIDPTNVIKNMNGTGSFQRENGVYRSTLDIQLPNLTLKDLSFEQINANFNFTYQDQTIDGNAAFTSLFSNDEIGGSFKFYYNEQEDLNIDEMQINARWLYANGRIKVLSKDQIEGLIHANIEDVSLIKMYFPNVHLEGALTANLELKNVENSQLLRAEIEPYDLQFNKINAGQGKIITTIQNLFGSYEAMLDVKLKNVRYFDYNFTSLNFFTSFEGQNWPFEISTTGCPLQFTSKGFWSYYNKDLNINLQELFGFFYEMAYLLNTPTDIYLGSDEFDLSYAEIIMKNGFFNGSIHMDKDRSNIQLKLENFPADLLSINPLNLSVQGTVSGEIDLIQEKDLLNGSIAFNTPGLSMLALGEEAPLAFNGIADVLVSDNQFKIQSELFIQNQKALNLNALFSGYISWFPFHFTFAFRQKSEGDFFYKGKIEDFIDFFNIGANYIQGDLLCNFQWKGTFDNPEINGFLEVKDGIFENYSTGIYLEEIETKMEGSDNLLTVTTFNAKDLDQGFLTADGAIKLSYLESFPFEFQLKLDEITAVSLGSITAISTGDLFIQGNFKSAIASGHLLINEGELNIPDRLPSTIPTIDVSYKNASLKREQTQFKKAYPLTLDVSLEIPESMFVYGRGLSSQWGGQLKLEGLYTELVTAGRLDLIRGDFNFSGHSFDLTSGELIFSGDPNAMPFLNISARTNVQGITISAKWSGRLNEPNLEFTSLPPMPLSSILSYLLFGSDLSEISALQAVTLAATAATLSGSPDILEITRRKLGVDKLAVVSSPTSEGDENYAVQVGKYVAKGVLLTFSQGIEQGSTNIIVNVDLKYGFMFQAETIQQQEQGRFSLLWNRNF